jgi:hypothetical protein
MATKTKKRNVGTYRKAVERIARALRRRFESGELRANTDEDYARSARDPSVVLPMWKIEEECEKRFIVTQEAALLVHSASPRRRGVERFDWRGKEGGPSLQGSAAMAMALDVLAYAKGKGWTERQPIAGNRQPSVALVGANGAPSVGEGWCAAVEQLRALYSAEVERLAEEFEPRIRAGEFSGYDASEAARYDQLADELRASHPMLDSLDRPELNDCNGPSIALVGVSDWPARRDALIDAYFKAEGVEIGFGEADASECLAMDVLDAAARRGWVKPYAICFGDEGGGPFEVIRRSGKRRAA